MSPLSPLEPTEEKDNFDKLTSSQNYLQIDREPEIEILSKVELPEITMYQKAKEISHFAALKDNLIFSFKPELRKEKENYITKESIKKNKKGLAHSNWQEISDLTVANLYWYFKSAV